MQNEYFLLGLTFDEFSTRSESSLLSDESNVPYLKLSFELPPIPEGKEMKDIRERERIIKIFYSKWKEINPEQKVYNENIKEDILIRMISIVEASHHGAKNYKSTLAVLMLDEVLSKAKKVAEVATKTGNQNQIGFTKFYIMEHDLDGIGKVRLTVGVKIRTKNKIQYGISVPQK